MILTSSKSFLLILSLSAVVKTRGLSRWKMVILNSSYKKAESVYETTGKKVEPEKLFCFFCLIHSRSNLFAFLLRCDHNSEEKGKLSVQYASIHVSFSYELFPWLQNVPGGTSFLAPCILINFSAASSPLVARLLLLPRPFFHRKLQVFLQFL